MAACAFGPSIPFAPSPSGDGAKALWLRGYCPEHLAVEALLVAACEQEALVHAQVEVVVALSVELHQVDRDREPGRG